jgi:hypothetical protein
MQMKKPCLTTGLLNSRTVKLTGELSAYNPNWGGIFAISSTSRSCFAFSFYIFLADVLSLTKASMLAKEKIKKQFNQKSLP